MFVRARRSVCASKGCADGLLVLCNRRCAASECTKGRERRGDSGGWGVGEEREQEGENLLAQNMTGVAVRETRPWRGYSRDATENQVSCSMQTRSGSSNLHD